jgi:undecaprenyl-diphosphatase
MVGRVGALVLVGLVLAELTDNVFDHDGLTVVDRPWHQWIVAHRSPVLTQLANGVSTLGSTTVLAVLAGCVAAWLAWRRQWAQAILVGVTTGGAGLLVPLAKNVVGRPRPPVADRLMVETSWSYPSGHSLGAAAVVGVLTVVLVSRLAGRAVRAVVIAAGVLVVVAIGLSRVYLGVHWPSDVLAGWLLGGLWLAICCALTSRWQVANRPLPTLDPTDQGQRDQGERGES